MSPNNVRGTNDASPVTAAVNLVLGLWVFASPWVYHAAADHNAWNSWILGFLVALFALIRLVNPVEARWLGKANMILAVWLFVSPWIFAYTMNTGRFVNSLCAGVLIFVLSAYGSSTRHTPLTQSPNR